MRGEINPRFHSRLLLMAVTWPDGGRLHPPRSRLHFVRSFPRGRFQPTAAPLWRFQTELLPAFIAIFGFSYRSSILSQVLKCVKGFVSVEKEHIFDFLLEFSAGMC